MSLEDLSTDRNQT